MVGQGKSSAMLQAISRATTAFALAFTCLTWTQAARAQDTPSDVVTRLGRLEETVRDLTGQVQELQYRNQQLEQQVQRLQGGAAAPMAGAPATSMVAVSHVSHVSPGTAAAVIGIHVAAATDGNALFDAAAIFAKPAAAGPIWAAAAVRSAAAIRRASASRAATIWRAAGPGRRQRRDWPP